MRKTLIALTLVIILLIALSSVVVGHSHRGPFGQNPGGRPDFAPPTRVIAPPPQVVPTGPPSPVPPDHPLTGGLNPGFERMGFEQWERGTTPPWAR